MPRALCLSLAAGTVAAVAWWLFADTVGHYYPPASDPNTIRFAHFGTFQDYETWGRVGCLTAGTTGARDKARQASRP